MEKKEDLFEKAIARKVGDTHPNGKWVWTEYKSGKFDWRPAKGQAASGGGDESGGEAAAAKTPSKPSSAQVANAKAQSGKAMNSQQLIDWAEKTSDDNLAKVANNKNGNAQLRKIAYDALEKRGYDMSSIDTTGTLSTLLKMTKKPGTDGVAPAAPGSSVDVDGDEEESEEITEKWYLNPEDDRVKKKFNLKTKEGRIKYDQFVYKMKKQEPDYLNPVEVIQDLNEQYLEFLDNDKQRFMISAGGAGIGKTYGFKKLAEALNMKPFEEGDQPGDDDYDYFEAPDVNSGKQLLSILKAHNGKIILFDDNDKVLRRADAASVMKKATATTGKRIVSDSEDVKSNFEFTGRIMIMTNKNLAALSENEDTKAIISRAMQVSEIYMTVPETIEVMKSRFQDMEFEEVPRLDDEKEDKKEREEILNLIVKNQKNIDPSKFTTRTFQEMLNAKRKVDNANAKRGNAVFASLIGDKSKNWQEKAISALTKAEENELSFFSSNEDILKSEEVEELEKAEAVIFDNEIEKSRIDLDISELSLEKAENIIFGEELEKAKSGVYADTAENRKIGRVGQEFGKKTKAGEEYTSTLKKQAANASRENLKKISESDKYPEEVRTIARKELKMREDREKKVMKKSEDDELKKAEDLLFGSGIEDDIEI